MSASSVALLTQARGLVLDAARTGDPGERFRLAHLAALRVAAAAVAQRGRPASVRRKLISVWLLLDKVAPGYAYWSGYFAAGAVVRAAVEAGTPNPVCADVADAQLAAATAFLAEVAGELGMLAA
jgi:hypothetical protein